MGELIYPKFIEYTGAGLSAEWLDKPVRCSVLKNKYEVKEMINVHINSIQNDTICVTPFDSYDFSNGIGVITFKIKSANNHNYFPEYVYCPIMTYLNTEGKEALDGWDGTAIDVIDKDGNPTSILAP